MGISIPQVVTEDRASGALVVDSCLTFNPTANGSGGRYLHKTPAVNGNRRTWTWSSWIKRGSLFGSNDEQHILDSRIDDDDRFYGLAIAGTGKIFLWEEISSGNYHYHTTTSTFRDTGAWFHLVVVVDTTQKTAADRVKFYVNGEQQPVDANSGSYPYYAENYETNVNQAGSKHFIGSFNDARNFSGSLSQVYLIDGLGLGPGYFGFTDPLTNTWRPKKFKAEGTTVNNGTNWSAGLTGTADGSGAIGLMFDGDTTDGSWSNSSGYSVAFPNGGVTATNNIKIYGGSASANWYVVIDGVQTTINEPGGVAPAWSATGVTGHVNLGPGTLSSIGTQGSGIAQNGEVSAIEIDGVIMKDSTTTNLSFGTNGFYFPMDGNSPAGEDKSATSSINNGTIWSSYLVSTSDTLQNVGQAFDGDISTRCNTVNAGANEDLTFRPPAINFTTSLEVYCDQGSNVPSATWNGNTVNPGQGAWVTVYSGSGELSSSYPLVIDTESASQYATLKGVRIDGEVLVDAQIGKNSYKSVYLGGSVEIDKANGAKPILNTTTGGRVARSGPFGSDVSKTIAVTVSNATGSNKYYFDGVLNPSQDLIRGAIITFDTSDSSNNSHPFKLSSTNADSSGGTEYTDGVSYFVNGSQKSASDYVSQYSSHSSGFRGIKWTIPHNVSTTYYYCTQHNGMGNNGRLYSTTDETKADPYAWKCFLALPLNGTPFDMSSTLNRTSSGKAITNNGTNQSSVTSNFYGRSALFDGSNDQLNVEASGQLDFGANDDWTFELWFNTTTVTGGWAISDYNNNNSATGDPGGQIYFSASSGAGLHWYQNSARLAEIPKEEILPNHWHHVAFVKDGTNNTISSFLDGVHRKTDTLDDSSGSTANGLNIGQQGGGTFFSGYMQDFRVYKGIKKYTGNFTPASSNPEIRLDTPSGVAVKSNLKKITDGSVSFDNTNDTLDAGSSSDFELSSDHTVEAWIYPESTNAESIAAYYYYTDGAAERGWFFAIQTSTQKIRFGNAGTGTVVTSTNKVPLNAWTHVAAVTTSGTTQIYIDGKADGSAASVGTPTYSDARLTVGSLVYASAATGYGNYFDGFISNVRIVKGTAVYSGNFTPPTRALTNITNTKLLCCQSPTSELNAAVAPSSIKSNWIPAGYTYWDAGYTAGFSYAGSRTSKPTRSDYIPSALPTTGKYYWEIKVDNVGTYHVFGVTDKGGNRPGENGYEDEISGFYVNNNTSQNPPIFLAKKAGGPSGTSTADQITHGESSGTVFGNGNVIMFAFDADADKMWIGRNGIWYDSGNPSAGTNASFQDMPTSGAYFKTAYSTTGSGNMTFEILSKSSGPSASNFNPFNTDIDTVRGQESNYCTWNPLTMSRGNIHDGNLLFYGNGTNTPRANGTISKSSGKWYYEVTVLNDGPGTGSGDVHNSIGWGLDSVSTIETAPNTSAMDHSFYFMDSGYYKNFSGDNTNSDTGKWLAGDVIGVAADLDKNILTFFRNGVQVLSQTIGTAAGTSLCPVHQSNTGNYGRSVANFGQNPFKFPPPEGFQTLSALSLRSDDAISRPDKFVSATLYTGDSNTSQDIDVGFAPDLVWQKIYSQDGNNALTDTVRGVGAGYIKSDSPDGQTGNANDGVSAFLSNGFRAYNGFNNDGLNWVSWCWKAGGSSSTFNIDDVGYASASDAGMSVGALNSVAYNSSKTWSNNINAINNPTNAFDGNTGTYAQNPNDTQVSQIVLSDIGGLSGRVRVWVGTSGGNRYMINLNDGTTVTTATSWGGGWVDVGVSSDIHNITVTRINGGDTLPANECMVYAYEIDGKMLLDSGVSVPTNIPSIAPTGCSVGTKQGFSIIKYGISGNSGYDTIAHGLTQAPEFGIFKCTSDGNTQWGVYHTLNGTNTNWVQLNDTAAGGNNDASGGLAGGAYVGYTDSFVQIDRLAFAAEGSAGVGYMWHSVPGLQKFGVYDGTGSGSTAPFIELGFRPAIVVLKAIVGGTGNWVVLDDKRPNYNSNDLNTLCWNLNADHDASGGTSNDIVSNGFKIRGSSDRNASNTKYLYAAWAASPFSNLYGASSNAR